MFSFAQTFKCKLIVLLQQWNNTQPWNGSEIVRNHIHWFAFTAANTDQGCDTSAHCIHVSMVIKKLKQTI